METTRTLRSSPLQQARIAYQSPLPEMLQSLADIAFTEGPPTESIDNKPQLAALFPKTYGQPLLHFQKGVKGESSPRRIGVVLSGGQAAGGHNVIAGLFDALHSLNPNSTLIGFLGGPSGIISNKSKEITPQLLSSYRNVGGFDMIGSGRTKIETAEQLQSSLTTIITHKLDGLVVIGGDDSNTNAALLAEYFLSKGCKTQVIGVPKTIDGDLKNQHVEVSFGFDTACKVYSEMIGNILRDCLSAKKYTHFIKLMGRSASHITLECALQTHPNMTFIGEEVRAKKSTLQDITKELCDMLCMRAEKGKNYGVILIPEGLIEFIPEIGTLIQELNDNVPHNTSLVSAIDGSVSAESRASLVCKQLSSASATCFKGLPEKIQLQLLLDRDPHGNVQVSRIETEQLLIATCTEELKRRETAGAYKGTFTPISHFFGYEGRSGFPSNFDTHYCYALGTCAATLINGSHTGYMATLQKLTQPVAKWQPMGIPLTMLMTMEQRHGKPKAVIQKRLTDLSGKPFKTFAEKRATWAIDDDYRCPGPIQFWGDKAITEATTLTLHLEHQTQAGG